MKTKYFYGTEDFEYYTATDLDSAYEEIRDYCGDKEEAMGSIIIEMVKNRESGERWCIELQTFIDECLYCDSYKPRNGKNGICKHLTYGLIETGRKFKIIGEYKYKKISSRRRKL